MKRTDCARPAQNASYPLYRLPGTARAEAAVFGTLGVVSLAAVCVALSWGTTPDIPHRSSLAGYFHSGRAEADLRTADSMVQYLMDPEPPMLTNLSDGTAQKNLAVPTNTVIRKPSA